MDGAAKHGLAHILHRTGQCLQVSLGIDDQKKPKELTQSNGPFTVLR